MKKLSVILFLYCMVMVQACNDSFNSDSVSKADSANDHRDTTSMMPQKDSATDMRVNDDVADFAVKAADGGMMEVRLSDGL